MARNQHGVAVRDNTRPDVQLTFDHASWRVLLAELRNDGLTG